MAKRKKISIPISNKRDLEIVSNIGLVHRLAQKYKQFCNNTSITYSDLVQEGVIGLMIARKKYDPKRGTRFSTYANYWIRAKIIRLLDRHYSTIHVTYSASAEYNKLIKKYGSLNGARGYLYQSMEELIETVTQEYRKGKIKESEYKKFVDILQAKSPLNFTHITLDTRSVDGGDVDSHTSDGHALQTDDSKLGLDILAKLPKADSIEDILARKSVVTRVLERLNPDELKLIKLYHGLDGNKEHTYKEIASLLKCSRQKAYQWHQAIIKKLRAKLKNLCLKDSISQEEIISSN